jgi:predicted nucleotidyltransferase
MGGHGVACCQPVRGQDVIVQAGIRWAERDERVRALLLKGSLARGEGDEYSDVDFLVVAQPGQLQDLWADRVAIAEGLGGWLGGFDEVAWQAPHTFIGFCDGPVKVDFFFQEGEPHADPWLRDGFRALVDEHGVADRLRTQLQAPPEPPDLSDFDAHAWDWLWAARLKLRRPGHEWLVYLELVKFVETMLLTGFAALAPEPWRGVLQMEERLPSDARAQLGAALPAAPEDAELRRALRATIASYVELRPRLAAQRRMPLADDLAAQVLPVLQADAP